MMKNNKASLRTLFYKVKQSRKDIHGLPRSLCSLAMTLTVLFSLLMSFSAQARERDKFLDIQEHQTQSGLSFWLVEDHSIPVIALDFAFDNAGAQYDTADKQGLAKLASNTMDEGAGDLTSSDFQGELREKSISLGFASGRDTFGGSLKTRTSTKDRAAELLHLALTVPRFEEADVKRMKDANIARIRSSLSDPGWIAARLANDVIFEGQPYALNSGGTISTLEALTKDDLQTFVSQRLAKDVLNIAIVGDVSAEEAKIMIDQIFGSLPKQQSLGMSTQDFDLTNQGTTYLYETDIPQSIVNAYLPALPRTDPDYYAFQVMNQILGAGGFGSRLTEEVREKRGLTYGIYTYLTQMEHVDFLTLASSTANKNAGEMIKLAEAELVKMTTEPVTDKELHDAVSYINGSLPLTLSSTSNISSLLLGMQLDGLPIDYLDMRAAAYNQVTKEDILRTAQKYLKPEKMVYVIVGKPEGLEEEHVTRLSELPNVQ